MSVVMIKHRKRKDRKESIMKELMKESPPLIRVHPGEAVEGVVVFRGKNKLLIDLGGTAVGIVSGRELRDSFNTFKDLKLGNTILTMVLEEENDEGMVVLSLRMASQQKAWDRFHKLIDEEGTMKFTAQEANKGGLLANIDGIRTFLPVSQLAPVHYPRVSNAESTEIMSRLQRHVGTTFTVKIITMDEEAGKIVVSERAAMAEERAKALEKLKIGDVKDGAVTGVVKFGLFVAFDGLEGLVHISEIAWGHVKNPSEHAGIGDRVKVQVIGIDSDKLSLSMKQLTKDPWEEIAERYPVGKRVQGSVVRFADYGAFLKLEKDINGLVHLTELAHHKITDPSEVLTIGQRVDAQVINIDVDERRIGLSIKALLPIDKETLERLKKEREEARAKEEREATERKEAKEAGETKRTKETVEESASTPSVSSSGPRAQPSPKLQPAFAEASAGRPAGTAADKKERKEEKTDRGFVASKTGKKFYPVDSPSGKRIKEENRMYFTTKEEAVAAGFGE